MLWLLVVYVSVPFIVKLCPSIQAKLVFLNFGESSSLRPVTFHLFRPGYLDLLLNLSKREHQAPSAFTGNTGGSFLLWV